MTNTGTQGTEDAPGTLLEANADPQRTLRRALRTYVPLTLLSLIPFWMSLESLLRGNLGALFPFPILCLITGSLGYQAYSSYLDLHATPAEMTAAVRRIWSKGAVLWLFRSHYMLLGRSIFVIEAISAYDLKEGDVVEVHYLPHTNTVTELRLLHREIPPTSTESPGRGMFGRR